MIAFCEYEVTELPSGRVLLTCKVCSFTREWSHPKLVRKCGVQSRPTTHKPRDPCIHRGEVLRTEPCRSCGKRVLVKVFACALHGECTVQKLIGELARCGTCEDYACDTSS